MKKRYLFIFLGILGLIFLFLAFILLDVKYPGWGLLSKASVISPAIITILTFSYVIITKNQLKQLKSDFNYSSKPLPWISKGLFYIEKPNLWMYPGNNKVEIHIFSRYVLKLNIKNIGDSPALSVDMKTTLEILDINKGLIKEFRSIDKHYSFLDKNIEKEESIMFPLDFENNLIDSFVNNPNEYPVLTIEMFFRNYLGKIFKVTFSYILNCEKEENEIIGDLNKIIKKMRMEHHEALKSIGIKISKDENYAELETKIKNSFNFDKTLIFNMDLIEIPNDNLVETIPYKEYKKIKDKFNSSKIVKGKTNHCSSSLIKIDKTVK